MALTDKETALVKQVRDLGQELVGVNVADFTEMKSDGLALLEIADMVESQDMRLDRLLRSKLSDSFSWNQLMMTATVCLVLGGLLTYAYLIVVYS